MKINGNANPKITEEGLLKMARKLALVIASIAFSWLYFFMNCYHFEDANLFEKTLLIKFQFSRNFFHVDFDCKTTRC